jgi:penicillin-binding protein 2
MLATPLQLATASAVLANGGRPVHPHLLKAVQDAKTREMKPVPAPPEDSQPVVKPENLALVRSAMVDVTRPGGTAVAAFNGAPYAVAAKTGTAQVIGMKQGEKYDERRLKREHWDHALFIAFAPADDPKLALGILVENGQHGGSTAGPIAREVLDYYLLGKEPVRKDRPTADASTPDTDEAEEHD